MWSIDDERRRKKVMERERAMLPEDKIRYVGSFFVLCVWVTVAYVVVTYKSTSMSCTYDLRTHLRPSVIRAFNKVGATKETEGKQTNNGQFDDSTVQYSTVVKTSLRWCMHLLMLAAFAAIAITVWVLDDE